MNKLKLTLFALMSALLLHTAAHAHHENKTLPLPITPYVSDFANLIDPETEARLNNALAAERANLDLQIAVVTIETIDEYDDWDQLDHFSSALFEQWKIGSPTRDDGILILISRSDRMMRIELGAAYGPIIANRLEQVIDYKFIPYFKGDQYAFGIESGTLEVINRLQSNYGIKTPEATARVEHSVALKQLQSDSVQLRASKTLRAIVAKTQDIIAIELSVALAILIGILLFLTVESRMRSVLIGLRTCPNCTNRTLNRRYIITKPTNAKGKASEYIETHCMVCGLSTKEKG